MTLIVESFVRWQEVAGVCMCVYVVGILLHSDVQSMSLASDKGEEQWRDRRES